MYLLSIYTYIFKNILIYEMINKNKENNKNIITKLPHPRVSVLGSLPLLANVLADIFKKFWFIVSLKIWLFGIFI